jgi:aromatic-L-amino-acid decarboxylase
MAADRGRGLIPLMLTATFGTTTTGAIDPIGELAAVCREHGCWFHVDGAYGAAVALLPEWRDRTSALREADSITLDPHKGLFLPYGTGCLLVKDVGTLRRAHTVRADYMPPIQDSDELVDFCEISPELSRDYRGLRVWLPIKIHGLQAFRDALDEKLDLTQWVCRELETTEGIEIVAAPQLSVVAFRLAPPGIGESDLNQINRELIERINAKKRVFLNETVLEGRFVIRICILNFRTHRDRVEMCLDDIRSSVSEILAARSAESVPHKGPHC